MIALSYNDIIIGLRFKTEQGVFDADRASLRKYGVHNLRVEKVEHLRPFGNLLMTEEEFNTDLHTEDISDSPKLESIVKALRQSEKYQYMFRFLRPYEQDVEELLISGWLPEYQRRSDEYNGQHNLFLPDGSRYRGGWIGKGKNFDIVLRNFHYEQCYWYIHRGGTPSPEAIKTYSDLKRYNDIIEDIKQNIKIEGTKHGERMEVRAYVPLTDGTTVKIDGKEFLTQAPYEKRGLFSNFDYSNTKYQHNKSLNVKPYYKNGGFSLDLREITMIAYIRKFLEFFRFDKFDLGHLADHNILNHPYKVY